jgi:hypothetical protein
MTRKEADKIHDLFMNVPNVNVTFDPATGIMYLDASGPNTVVSRSFTIDSTPAAQTQINTGSNSITITLPTFTSPPTYQVYRGSGTPSYHPLNPGDIPTPATTLKCCCGADSVGGLHSSWCNKNTDLPK